MHALPSGIGVACRRADGLVQPRSRASGRSTTWAPSLAASAISPCAHNILHSNSPPTTGICASVSLKRFRSNCFICFSFSSEIRVQKSKHGFARYYCCRESWAIDPSTKDMQDQPVTPTPATGAPSSAPICRLGVPGFPSSQSACNDLSVARSTLASLWTSLSRAYIGPPPAIMSGNGSLERCLERCSSFHPARSDSPFSTKSNLSVARLSNS